ncbi:MAG: hypothetical protein GWO24_14795, partial [Akkermansiaceae bacterium]|nr:hypothetical protein [Akkermansiaceae bacterium]
WRPAKAGDGIRAVVVTNGGVLGEWKVAPGNSADPSVGAFRVEADQVVDFIVESTGNQDSDTFHWEPVIVEEGGDFPLAEAKAGFSGPALEPWAQLAQILLLSNEFLFVD